MILSSNFILWTMHRIVTMNNLDSQFMILIEYDIQ